MEGREESKFNAQNPRKIQISRLKAARGAI
jgi:hypothetical protein